MLFQLPCSRGAGRIAVMMDSKVCIPRVFLARALPAVACVLVLFAPTAARADFTSLTSSNQISGTVFTFDGLDVGFVDGATNDATRPLGFTFPDAGPSNGEYIASDSDGGHVLDVLGQRFGFDGFVRFRFEELVGAAGIDFDTSTTLSLIALDNDLNFINAEGTISGLADTRGFFGIASDLGIRELWVHDSAGTFELDNLLFGVAIVPVPGALALGAFGMVLAGLVRRRT